MNEQLESAIAEIENLLSQRWDEYQGSREEVEEILRRHFTEPPAADAVLLHNERLIMERRRWFVKPYNEGWIVCDTNGVQVQRNEYPWQFTGTHPIGLLSEADAYFRERDK